MLKRIQKLCEQCGSSLRCSQIVLTLTGLNDLRTRHFGNWCALTVLITEKLRIVNKYRTLTESIALARMCKIWGLVPEQL